MPQSKSGKREYAQMENGKIQVILESRAKPKEFVTSHKMLDWQYFQILGELQEIQRHDSDPTCPCRLSDDLGENCLAKHTLGLSVLAAETAAMDQANKDMLQGLSAEAKQLHEQMKGFLCHTKDAPEFTNWSRQWRKKIEPLYYHASCKIKMRQDCPTCQIDLQQAANLEARPIPKEQLPFDFDKPLTAETCPPICPVVQSVSTGTKYQLFPFQQEGYTWLKGRSFALLADDMGLGKTPQGIAWGSDFRPNLVIVPAALTYNWVREITEMWRLEDTVVLLDGKTELPRELPDWTVMSYGMVNHYLPKLRRAGFKALLIDEAHLVKNMETARTKNILELVAPQETKPGDKIIPNRLAITGTPVLNRPIELFALLVFLGVKNRSDFKDFLNTYTEHKTYKGRLIFTGAKNLYQLHEFLKPFMLRRLKKDVLKQLPPKTNTPLFVAITNASEYREAENHFLEWLRQKAGDEAAMNASRAEIITRMNALRQLAASGKVAPVCDWLKPCRDGQGKVIVFSSFLEPLESLKKCKPESVIYTGADSSQDRQVMVDKFQHTEDVCCFLGTVGAAGVGITLTAASRVAFLDLPWTPGGKVQAEDRAHRIGQTKPVEVVNVLARGTIDERMLQLLSDKEFIIAQAIDGKTKDEAMSTSVANSLVQSFIRAPNLNQNITQYQREEMDPEPYAISFDDQKEIAEGLRQDELAPTVKITGKCATKDPHTCEFSIRRRGKPHIVKREVKAAKVVSCHATGVSDLIKQSRELAESGKCVVKRKAIMRQEPTAKITGTCSTKGCNLVVKGVVETTTSSTSSGLPKAIETVIDKLGKRGGPGEAISDKTFAPGISTSNRYEMQFKVIEASDLIVSHDPFTFVLNPKYTAKLQPRLRERLANQSQVRKIAAGLDPEKLLLDTKAIDTGSPIINTQNYVLCGNGRVMALILAASEHPGNIAKYKLALRDVAPKYALSVDAIAKMKLPVLVRVLLTKTNEQAFAEECNARPTIEASAIEKARTDAEKITTGMLNGLDILEGEPIEDALRSGRNKPFVTTFLSKLPENEQALLIDARGQLNSDGVRRMGMAIFVATFKGDVGLKLAAQFFEALDTNVKNAFNGILRSLGGLAQAENLVATGQRNAGYAFGEDLAKAITVFSSLRTAGMSVSNYINQQQMISRELTPFQERVLQVLDEHTRSAKRIGEILSNYAQAVIDSPPPNQVSLIADTRATKEELFENAVKKVVEDAEAVRRTKEPAAAMSCGPICLLTSSYKWLSKKLSDCNLSERDQIVVFGWKPLRDFLSWAVGRKEPVQVCSAGMVPGVYQVSIMGIGHYGDRSTDVSNRAKSVPGMKRIFSRDDNAVFEVVVPEESKQELAWQPQSVSRTPARSEGVQPAMFQKQMLLTKELREKLPPLYSQENVKDPMVLVKFFTPDANWTWYGIEFDGKDVFFGYVIGHEKELGYFSLRELESARGKMGLPIERDKWFDPTPLSKVRELEHDEQAEMHADPLLMAIGCQIGVGCLANSKKSKLPVCNSEQKTRRESCIIDVKAKLPKGCGPKEWNKPEGERMEGCYNPFAVCSASVGCKAGRNAK